jgi:hypothetical protein
VPDETIPSVPIFFPPQQTANLFAAGEAFFLIDPARLLEVGGEHLLHSDLLRHLAPNDPRTPRKASIRRDPTQDLYEQGALVPAFGLERGIYNVHIRSTQTENAPLPLTHIVFSAGFVLGTSTGRLVLANSDRLQPWSPGTTRVSKAAAHSAVEPDEKYALAKLERTIEISPGWYNVTVLAGLRDTPEEADQTPHEEPSPQTQRYDDDYSQDPDTPTPRHLRTQPRTQNIQQQYSEEQWICAFLLDPQPTRPLFTADIHKTLNIFNP